MPFEKTFQITDIKLKIVGLSFITKLFPTMMILKSKIHIRDKDTRNNNKSLTFFQRIN